MKKHSCLRCPHHRAASVLGSCCMHPIAVNENVAVWSRMARMGVVVEGGDTLRGKLAWPSSFDPRSIVACKEAP